MRNRKLLNKRVIRVLLLFLVVLSLPVFVLARFNYLDPKVDSWYDVQPWELEVCRTWGGTQEAESGATTSAPIYLSRITISLQGKKQVYDVAGFNQTLYTASWSLEPLSNINYTVELVGRDPIITPRTIAAGTARYTDPAIGYYPNSISQGYLEGNYTLVRMIYGSEWVEVPIIDLG
ncbi:MAG: hypothetical protein U9O94_11725 [Nanoarchaeota archaeon]|nr:hypothetical protein [Nanoarchaeota archaeon]